MEWKQLTMVFAAMLLLAPTAFATYTCNSTSIVGDVNGDGQITADDANAASYLFMHSNELPSNTCCIDVAPSTGVNNGDAVKINLYVNNGGPNANTGDIGKRCYEINNQPPVISGTGGPTSVLAGQMSYWSVNASDPESGLLSVSVNWGDGQTSGVSGYTAANMPAILGYTYQSAGTYTITFTVTDSPGASTQSTITVAVGAGTTSLPDLALTDISISKDSHGDMAFSAYVKNVGSATSGNYEFVWYFDGASGTPVNVTAALAPGESQMNGLIRGAITPGWHTIKAKLTPMGSDATSSNNELSKNFEMLASSNQPPVISRLDGSVIWPYSISPSQQGMLAVYASDPEGGALSYSVNWGDGSLSANTSSIGYAIFYHQYASAGTYTIKITVKDPTDLSAEKTITTTVHSDCKDTETPVGSEGYYVKGTTTGMNENGQTGSFTDYCDGNTLKFYACLYGPRYYTGSYACPNGCSNGACQGSPVPNNQPPVIASVGGPTSLSANTAGTWIVSAYDPDGTYLSYSVMWGDEGVAPLYRDAVGSTATFQHTYAQAGTYTITFTVKDAQGASAQSTAAVVVGSGTIQNCDGYTDLQVGKAINTGTYSMKLADVAADGSGSAIIEINDYTGALLAEEKVAPGTKYVYGTNGIAVEVCKSSSKSSAKIKAYSTTLPATLPCAGYTTRHKGQMLDRGEYKATLTDVTVESETGMDVAIFDIYDSAGRHITSEPIHEGSASIYSENGSAKTISMKVCQIARGTNGAKWAKLAMSVEAGANKAPVITSVGGPTSITASSSQVSMWTIGGYDPEGGPVLYSVNWGDGHDSGGFVNAANFGYSYPVPGTYTITFTAKDAQGATTQSTLSVKVTSGITPSGKITLRFEKGWNQVSVPAGYYMPLSDIQAKCQITSAWEYSTYTGQYTAVSYIGRRDSSGGTRHGGIMTGIWMKASADCTYELVEPYDTATSIPLKAGWNMIGSPLTATTMANFAGDCKITSGPWNYSPSSGQYVASSTLEPGKGYWVKVASECTLSSRNLPPSAPLESVTVEQVRTS